MFETYRGAYENSILVHWDIFADFDHAAWGMEEKKYKSAPHLIMNHYIFHRFYLYYSSKSSKFADQTKKNN